MVLPEGRFPNRLQVGRLGNRPSIYHVRVSEIYYENCFKIDWRKQFADHH